MRSRSEICVIVQIFQAATRLLIATGVVMVVVVPWELQAKENGKNGFLDLLRTSIATTPRIQAAKSKLDAAREKKDQGLAVLLPQVNAVSSAYKSKSEWTAGNTSSSPKSAGVEVSQYLVNIPALLSYNQTTPYIKAFEAELLATNQAVLLDSVRALLAVREAEESAKYSEEHLATARRNLAMTEASVNAGDMTNTDIQYASTQATNAIAELVRARNNVEITRYRFREAIGTDVTPEMNVPKISPASVNTPLKEVLARIDARPDIQAALLRLEVADQAVDVQKTEHLPVVSLSMTSNRYAGNLVSQQELQSDSMIMVKASLPLFHGGETFSKTREALATRSTQDAEVARIRLQAIREVEQARMTLENAQNSLLALQEAARTSRETLRGVTAEFHSGSRSGFDLMNTQNQLAKTETDLVKGRYAVEDAIFQLLYAQGELTLENLDKKSLKNGDGIAKDNGGNKPRLAEILKLLRIDQPEKKSTGDSAKKTVSQGGKIDAPPFEDQHVALPDSSIVKTINMMRVDKATPQPETTSSPKRQEKVKTAPIRSKVTNRKKKGR